MYLKIVATQINLQELFLRLLILECNFRPLCRISIEANYEEGGGYTLSC